MTEQPEAAVVERVSTVAPLSERELREEESTVQAHTATPAATDESHDALVGHGGKVAVISPNTLVSGVWVNAGMVPTLIQPRVAVKGGVGADAIIYAIHRGE